MNKVLLFILMTIVVQGYSQNYPITGINISLPASPDANTANWGTGKTMLTITATAKAVAGRVDLMVEESKLLITIKKGGVKVCGAFTGSSAPAANFSILTKVWSGTNAVSFLGKDCVLAPGDYEICVQFFGNGPVGMAPLSEEKCKSFTIREVEQLTYQPPQPVSPADGSEYNEPDLQKLFVFRWIPVIPKPHDPVTYRLTVWQLMQGQTGIQAMQVNQPLITKDVDNLTQTIVSNLTGGPCLPPYLCDFSWNVQALNREGKPIGENNGTSISSKFSAKKSEGNILAAESAGCKNYSFELRKIYKGDSVAYECIINNKYRGTDTKNNFKSFSIRIVNSLVIAIDNNTPKEWNRTPSKFPPGSSLIKWTNNSGDIPQGETKLGILNFAVPTSNPFYVIYEWLNREGKVICKDSMALTDNRFYYELDKEPSYNYAEISNNILRVQFFNHSASVENIKLSIYDVDEEKIKRKSKDVIKLNSVTGLNRISIDIKDYNLEPGRPYLLTISNSHGTYHFNFKVTNDREK